LSETDILNIAQQHQTTTILADGFTRPPVPDVALAFDADTYLIFLGIEAQLADSSELPRLGGPRPALRPEGVSNGSAVGGRFLRMLGAFLSLWLWGDWIYRLTISRQLPPSAARRVATSWLLGCGVTSLAIFILLWLGIRLTSAVLGFGILGCIFWFYSHRKTWRSAFSPSHPFALSSLRVLASSPLRLVFTFIITLQVGLVTFAAWASPLTDWDAWVNWASKANVLFIDQTLSPNLYHHPARLPTNMDYPLLLPLTEAWFYTWLGHIYEPVVGLISLLFYLALLLLFYHAARLLTPRTTALGFTALLATLPRLERPAHSGLADIPLAAFVFLSFLLLYEWYKTLSVKSQSPLLPGPVSSSALRRLPVRFASPPRLVPSSLRPFVPSSLHVLALALVLSAGLLPWLKNEGWLWWLLASLTLMVGVSVLIRGRRLSVRQAITIVPAYLLLTLALSLSWQFFLAVNGTYRYTFLPLTLTTFWTNLFRLPEIGLGLFARLLNPYWNSIWLFVGLILLSRNKKVGLAPLGWLILPVAGYMVLISFSYVFSRFEPYLAHLNNSVERLILQAVPLAGWWLIGQCVSMGWVRNNE
jgi:hypothetical protein